LRFHPSPTTHFSIHRRKMDGTWGRGGEFAGRRGCGAMLGKVGGVRDEG
jgi:hypothetical protein